MYDFFLDVLVPYRRIARFGFVKKKDAWWTVFGIDWLAVLMVFPLSFILPKKQGPNIVTAFSLLSASIGLYMLYYVGPLEASILFYIATVFDCVDGKLARKNEVRSKYGSVVDAGADLIFHGPGFALIALYMYLEEENLYAAVLILIVSIYMTVVHFRHIGRELRSDSLETCVGKSLQNKGASTWKYFCEKNGVFGIPFSRVEMTFLLVPLVSINVDRPELYLLFGLLAVAVQDFRAWVKP